MPNNNCNTRANDFAKTPGPVLVYPRSQIHIPRLVQDDKIAPSPRSGGILRLLPLGLRLGRYDEANCGLERRGSVAFCSVGYSSGGSYDGREE